MTKIGRNEIYTCL